MESCWKTIWVYGCVFNYHPTSYQWEDDEHDRADQKGYLAEIFTQALYLWRVALEERTVGEVSWEDVQPCQGKEGRDTCIEECGNDDNQIEVGCFLVNLYLEISDLPVHCFLKNFSLVLLKLIFRDATATEKDVDKPDSYGIENEIVGEERRDVSIPNIGERWIEVELGYFEEVGNITGDDGNEGDIATGFESEDICIDEYRYHDGVESEEDGIDGSFEIESSSLREGSHTIDQLIHNETKNDVSDSFSDQHHILDRLLDIYVSDVVLACCCYGIVTEGGD